MSLNSNVSTQSSPARADYYTSSSVALFCWVGLVASFCMVAIGLDLSIGWL
jgi:hypothetical protein